MPRAAQVIPAKLIAHDPENVFGAGHVLLGDFRRSMVRYCMANDNQPPGVPFGCHSAKPLVEWQGALLLCAGLRPEYNPAKRGLLMTPQAKKGKGRVGHCKSRAARCWVRCGSSTSSHESAMIPIWFTSIAICFMIPAGRAACSTSRAAIFRCTIPN